MVYEASQSLMLRVPALLKVSKNGLSVSYELIYVEDENADDVIDFNDIISRVMADISDSILVDKKYNSGYDMNDDSSVDIMDTTKLYDYLINGWDHQFDIDKDNKIIPINNNNLDNLFITFLIFIINKVICVYVYMKSPLSYDLS